jgi:hypothetical protein
MKTLTAFTSLYTETGTIRDVKQRGRAARIHPDAVTARDDARDNDIIAEVSFSIPDDAGYLFYNGVGEDFIVYAQGPDFPATYAEAVKASAGRQMTATITTGKPGGGVSIRPLVQFATGLRVVTEDSLAEVA